MGPLNRPRRPARARLLARSAGFTLIEVLIAATIMAIVLVYGSYVFRTFSLGARRASHGFEQSAAIAEVQTRLFRLFEGIVPFNTGNSASGRARVQFEGSPQRMFAVSLNGLVRYARPVVFELEFVPHQEQWSLVYREASLNALFRAGVSPGSPSSLHFGPKITLVQGLAAGRFKFFGYQSLAARIARAAKTLGPGLAPAWFDRYDGLYTELTPLRIKATLRLGPRRIEIQADPMSKPQIWSALGKPVNF